MQNNSSGNRNIMLTLQSVLENNPMTACFKNAFAIMQQQEHRHQLPQIRLKLAEIPGKDHCRYNLPTAQEIAVIMPGQGDDADGNTYRGIILHLKDGPLCHINELNPLYLPLHYVLLFPRGELGWHPNIALANEQVHHQRSNNNIERDNDDEQNEENLDVGNTHGQGKTVTQREWYAYQLHIWRSKTMLFYASALFQQFIVDAWAQLEQSHLNYIKNHQKDF